MVLAPAPTKSLTTIGFAKRREGRSQKEHVRGSPSGIEFPEVSEQLQIPEQYWASQLPNTLGSLRNKEKKQTTQERSNLVSYPQLGNSNSLSIRGAFQGMLHSLWNTPPHMPFLTHQRWGNSEVAPKSLIRDFTKRRHAELLSL